MSADTTIPPRQAIRRFDVFAEFNRLKALEDGRPDDEAKGYGIWLAKVVASRRFGANPKTSETGRRHHDDASSHQQHQKFRSVGDELQTDETFDHDIIDRMGHGFYYDVFAPAIEAALHRGEKYEDIRDKIRSDWKPTRGARR